FPLANGGRLVPLGNILLVAFDISPLDVDCFIFNVKLVIQVRHGGAWGLIAGCCGARSTIVLILSAPGDGWSISLASHGLVPEESHAAIVVCKVLRVELSFLRIFPQLYFFRKTSSRLLQSHDQGSPVLRTGRVRVGGGIWRDLLSFRPHFSNMLMTCVCTVLGLSIQHPGDISCFFFLLDDSLPHPVQLIACLASDMWPPSPGRLVRLIFVH
ncbi:hypothetical protein IWX91DRAFT_394565, partial [Phyllosticta citricarpa]